MTTQATSPTAPALLVEVDGRPATEADLRLRALDNYGHFTAMQVRDGAVRGLAPHLARLDSATQELFGTGLDGERVRALLRHALGEVRDASARVYVHQSAGAAEPGVMITVRPPAHLDGRAQRLMSVPYQRPAPHIKHLGGFGQIHSGRLAQRAGYDSALLVGPGGLVLEAATANVAFWDGRSLVWPEAPSLTGITMALLDSHLPPAGVPSVRREVTLADLSGYRAAFVTNSQGVAPVSMIDGTPFSGDEELLEKILSVYEAVPLDEV